MGGELAAADPGGRLAAVTGATGFLGRHIVRAFADEGWRVRALARCDPAPWDGPAPEVVAGDLEDGDALARLCRGADAVVHAAGLVRARRDGDFHKVNADGAGVMAAAARREAPGAAFVLVSSLAAREPQLSPYAASKRAGEDAVQAAWSGRAQVARPCAVYGAGDRAGLPLFRAAAGSPVLPIPDAGGARITLVHARDCARAIVGLAAAPEPGRLASVTDARADGYGWREIGEALALAAGRTPRLLPVPAAALRAAGRLGDLAQALGAAPMATSGKVREVLHGDWSVDVGERWAERSPLLTLQQGLEITLQGYRAAGWLG